MGILDEAIREHLELKRQHGADDSELKQLEDDAFGLPERPGAEDAGSDTLAEAATEFMAQPEIEAEPPEQAAELRPPRREPAPGMADIQEAPERVEEPQDEELPEDDDEHGPADEEQPAAEHEAVAEPPAGHTTEERHAIADQPTEMYDVEDAFESPKGPGPSDEDLVAEEIGEPRLAPAVDPIEETAAAEGDEADDEGEDDFFDEQRLSDELDQALEAPLEAEPEPEPAHETDEHGAVEDEHAEEEEGEPVVEAHHDEDVLEETPDFLEETPEDDQLWFEQKPPKDFDFDD